MLIDGGDFHASGPVFGPDNDVVLIRDMRKDSPLWKFPGGKKQRLQPFGKKPRGETPLETLLRETKEETGLWLKKRNVQFVTSYDMGSYRKHVFCSRISSFRGLVPLSKEYEEAKVFKLDDLPWLRDFHPWYRDGYLQHIVPLLNTP